MTAPYAEQYVGLPENLDGYDCHRATGVACPIGLGVPARSSPGRRYTPGRRTGIAGGRRGPGGVLGDDGLRLAPTQPLVPIVGAQATTGDVLQPDAVQVGPPDSIRLAADNLMRVSLAVITGRHSVHLVSRVTSGRPSRLAGTAGSGRPRIVAAECLNPLRSSSRYGATHLRLLLVRRLLLSDGGS